MSDAREDLFRITATLAGRDLGVFDTFKGGKATSTNRMYTPGGGTERALGGRKTVEPVTIGRNFDALRDDLDFIRSCRGNPKKVLIVTKQPVDADGVSEGKATIYRGHVVSVTDPESDSEGDGKAPFEIEQATGAALG